MVLTPGPSPRGERRDSLSDGYTDEPRLGEVLVAGERLDDTELAHDDEAGCVDQGPCLVVVLFEKRPCRIIDDGTAQSKAG